MQTILHLQDGPAKVLFFACLLWLEPQHKVGTAFLIFIDYFHVFLSKDAFKHLYLLGLSQKWIDYGQLRANTACVNQAWYGACTIL
ncbi:hypothetical protein FGO68_gene2243 [Halteria grandinella]|uniref:Uncharacterized protein n=1 Tax=Halteria grandinella TaxID=5974 RepID=A0A8J8TAE6_HALGN|nr:hypothetical protein FGO68_gene2243 [Halteria grandinella]